MKSEQQYIELFQQCRQLLSSQSDVVLDALRDEAFRIFKRIGLPDKKAERYKYTDVQEAFSPNYGLNLNRLQFRINPYDVFKCNVPNMSTLLYFIVNDAFHSKEYPNAKPSGGIIISSLNEAAHLYPDLVSKYYGQIVRKAETPSINSEGGQIIDGEFVPLRKNNEPDAITALNTMLVQDGLFIYVPKNTVSDKAIQVVNVLTSTVDLLVNRRVLVVLEEGAKAKLLFCDESMSDVNMLATQVMEVYAGPSSELELYELEETNMKNKRFSNLYVQQHDKSKVTLNSISLHNGLTRNMTYVSLEGEESVINLYGGVIADKEQHVDNHTLVDHKVPKCVSNELFKYVLDDNSVGAFAGRILVRNDAQKTESQETNANLCVTKTAHMFTQPMLEIYADDVKCNHGATVGQLNEAALFYMRQRGISLDEAKLLLKFAFVGEVIDKVDLEPLKDRLHYLVEKRFRGELNKCSGCRLC
ncbi:MAG: Fe-S cluster assembly protein SufD [Bacteroidaceae bacterium]|nr:Fe-S cluster assembly protein SufD [Bacteroidaceae bacterium]